MTGTAGERRTEVLVVGAGLSGLGVARALARRGARVTVLEAAPEDPEASASYAAEGLVSVETPEPYPRMAAALGEARTQALLDLSRRNADLLDTLSRACPEARGPAGSVTVTTDASELHEITSAATACGWELLPDENAVVSRAGAHGFLGGAMRPRDTAIDPQLILACLERDATAAGAVVRRGARVESVEVPGEGAAARLGTGILRAEMLVLCAGAAIGLLHPGLAACLVAVPGQGLTLSGKDGSGAPTMSLSANFGHVRLAWIGSGRLAGRTLRAWTIPWSLRRPENLEEPAAVDAALQQRLEGYIRSHIPAAAALPVTARRAARMAYTQDNLPLVGPLPGQPRIACCAGFSGHDWSLALAAADLLASALAGEPRDPVLEILSPRRLMVS